MWSSNRWVGRCASGRTNLVLGVLADFLLLDLLTEGCTVTVVRNVSAVQTCRGDRPPEKGSICLFRIPSGPALQGKGCIYRVPYLPVMPTFFVRLVMAAVLLSSKVGVRKQKLRSLRRCMWETG